ncbi:unnamed protein product, partial [Choristocarpus tenellus]
ERLDQATSGLEEAQQRARAEQRSFDRRLTHMSSEYERKINGLINHTEMSNLLQAAISNQGGQGDP